MVIQACNYYWKGVNSVPLKGRHRELVRPKYSCVLVELKWAANMQPSAEKRRFLQLQVQLQVAHGCLCIWVGSYQFGYKFLIQVVFTSIVMSVVMYSVNMQSLDLRVLPPVFLEKSTFHQDWNPIVLFYEWIVLSDPFLLMKTIISQFNSYVECNQKGTQFRKCYYFLIIFTVFFKFLPCF